MRLERTRIGLFGEFFLGFVLVYIEINVLCCISFPLPSPPPPPPPPPLFPYSLSQSVSFV